MCASIKHIGKLFGIHHLKIKYNLMCLKSFNDDDLYWNEIMKNKVLGGAEDDIL